MSSVPKKPERALRVPERRFHARRRVQSLAATLAPVAVCCPISVQAGCVYTPLPRRSKHTPPPWLRMALWANYPALVLKSSLGRFQRNPFLYSAASGFGRVKKPYACFSPPRSYHIREVRFDADWNRVVKSWTECHRQFPGRTLHCDPEWIEQSFKHEKNNVRIFLLES